MVTSLRLESWAGLRHVAASLEDLGMGDGTLKRISIAPMADLSTIRSLTILGPVRDADVIGALTTLEELTLRSVTLSDLSPLVGLPRLHSLGLLLGGTANLGRLPEIAGLRDLELWQIRGLRDVSILGALPRLQKLTLQSMSGVSALPSFANLPELRRVALDTMKGITDLQPVADAPSLEELLLIGMPQLAAESLRPLVGHPSLKRGIWGFGSRRKNAAAYDLLPIADPPYGHPDWQA